jgi:hypothetical protein
MDLFLPFFPPPVDLHEIFFANPRHFLDRGETVAQTRSVFLFTALIGPDQVPVDLCDKPSETVLAID